MRDKELEWPNLGEGEEEITDASEVLWRQVHPMRVHNNHVSSDAFVPRKNEDKKASTSRSSMVSTPEKSYADYTKKTGLNSAGVAFVTVEQVHSPEKSNPDKSDVVSLRAVDDSQTLDADLYPKGHAYIDFRPIGASRIARKSEQLAYFVNQDQFFSKETFGH